MRGMLSDVFPTELESPRLACFGSTAQVGDTPSPCSPRSTSPPARVIGECMLRHRHQEFLRFLRAIDRDTPKDLDLHLIVDNSATHKHAKVKAWPKRRPRFHIRFTATSASWIHLVERFFALITDKAIRRGVFPSVAELQARDPCLPRPTQRRPKALRLDRQSPRYPRKSRPRAKSVRVGTLGVRSFAAHTL
jgi:DDE superfamily endonuclease